MPTAKNNFALARYLERIYALGGNDGQNHKDHAECYDIFRDHWKVLPVLPMVVN